MYLNYKYRCTHLVHKERCKVLGGPMIYCTPNRGPTQDSDKDQKISALHGAHGQAVLSKQQKNHDEEPKMIIGSNHQNINSRFVSAPGILAINRQKLKWNYSPWARFLWPKIGQIFHGWKGEDNWQQVKIPGLWQSTPQTWRRLNLCWFNQLASFQPVWRLGPHLLVRKSNLQSVDPLETCISIVGGFFATHLKNIPLKLDHLPKDLWNHHLDSR